MTFKNGHDNSHVPCRILFRIINLIDSDLGIDLPGVSAVPLNREVVMASMMGELISQPLIWSHLTLYSYFNIVELRHSRIPT